MYLSFPTEYGTLYTRKELETIHEVCRRYDIPLYLDGARLAYGLAAEGCDLTLPDIAALTDVFYIGGTKVGALCGEAIVFPRGNAPKHFLTQIKQRGALRHVADASVGMNDMCSKLGIDNPSKLKTNETFAEGIIDSLMSNVAKYMSYSYAAEAEYNGF